MAFEAWATAAKLLLGGAVATAGTTGTALGIKSSIKDSGQETLVKSQEEQIQRLEARIKELESKSKTTQDRLTEDFQAAESSLKAKIEGLLTNPQNLTSWLETKLTNRLAQEEVRMSSSLENRLKEANSALSGRTEVVEKWVSELIHDVETLRRRVEQNFY